MIQEQLKEYSVILASQSPRRHALLKGLDIDFKVNVPKDIDEDYPADLKREQIVLFLAEKKAAAYPLETEDNPLIIAADTIVCLDDEVLEKPVNRDAAFAMIEKLSGRSHDVLTGVCIKSKEKSKSFYAVSKVKFGKLSVEEINYYLDHYQPYDKAGSYGIQEWIGYIGIETIEGSYFNVMGLPVHLLYEELKQF